MAAPVPSQVYLVPGLGGSELWLDSALTKSIYVNAAALSFGGLRLLWLDNTGYRPLPGVGKQCYVGQPLSFVYGKPWSTLAADPLLSRWTVSSWPYDWRLPLPYQGELLALDILQRVRPSAPCTIVGHSNGGALARYAWAFLRAGGHQNLVRRIITLGTPHQGSYASLAGMIGQLDWLNAVLVFQSAINALATGPWVSSQIGPYTIAEIALLQQSWQSWYHLLPNPFGSAFSADKNLPAIFTQNVWPPYSNVETGVLDFTFTDLLPAAVDPLNIPPSWVLTTVGGIGFATPKGVLRLPLRGKRGDLGSSTDGDGAVLLVSALVPGSYQVIFPYTHLDLVAASVAGGWLTAAILDPRGPPSPPPPPSSGGGGPPTGQVLPALVPSVLAGTPGPPPIQTSGPDP